MWRFRFRDLTPRRIIDGLVRRIFEVPQAIIWALPTRVSTDNQRRLSAWADRHKDQRCFILGNGPSLAGMDLSLLEHEFSFGLNRIYLLFEKLAFRPTFYVCVNEFVLEQFASEIGILPMPKFLNWSHRKHFNLLDDSIGFVKLSLGLQDGFATDFHHSLYSGGTVTFVALQIAFIMGFSEVILVGIDHSFIDKGIPNKIETRGSDVDLNHFHPDYFPKGVKWQYPDLMRSELAYTRARYEFERSGRKIWDATAGGKCPVFERVDYSSLF
jgi:hypothetical protein